MNCSGARLFRRPGECATFDPPEARREFVNAERAGRWKHFPRRAWHFGRGTCSRSATPLAGRPEDRLQKYLDEIERRARQGKCFHRPALGVREFAADFEWVEGEPDGTLACRAAENGQAPEQFNEDLGLMLYDVFDHRERGKRASAGCATERFPGALYPRQTHIPQKARRPKKPAEVPRWRGRLIQPQPLFRARIEVSWNSIAIQTALES